MYKKFSKIIITIVCLMLVLVMVGCQAPAKPASPQRKSLPKHLKRSNPPKPEEREKESCPASSWGYFMNSPEPKWL